MSVGYTGLVEGITPATSDDNWALDAGSGILGRILEAWWGGEETSSTAMRTVIARSGSEAGAGTAGNVAKWDADAATNAVNFYLTYATTQPTLDAASLWGISWNAHGGAVRWAHQLGFRVTNALISCRNKVGTGTSTYGVSWIEGG